MTQNARIPILVCRRNIEKTSPSFISKYRFLEVYLLPYNDDIYVCTLYITPRVSTGVQFRYV